MATDFLEFYKRPSYIYDGVLYYEVPFTVKRETQKGAIFLGATLDKEKTEKTTALITLKAAIYHIEDVTYDWGHDKDMTKLAQYHFEKTVPRHEIYKACSFGKKTEDLLVKFCVEVLTQFPQLTEKGVLDALTLSIQAQNKYADLLVEEIPDYLFK